jgi:transcriptional regulator with XRE-family HTH domain
MNNRLKQFLAAENITQAQFADTINVVRASVSHVLSGRNNPGYDFIKAIMNAYPLLNVEWLMLGKGRMYKDGRSDTVADAGLLFNDIESTESTESTESSAVISAPEQRNDHHEISMDDNIADSTAIQTSINCTQSIVKQRKISKIIVLFDDGTFEEMGQ